MPTDADLQARREQIVRDQLNFENEGRYDEAIAAFETPRYEIIATGEVFEGEDGVLAYFDATSVAFPDQNTKLVALHHAEDAVIAEYGMRGTHRGHYRGVPATGRKFVCPAVAFYVFEQGDKLVCTRIYYDALTILVQLHLVGSAPVEGEEEAAAE